MPRIVNTTRFDIVLPQCLEAFRSREGKRGGTLEREKGSGSVSRQERAFAARRRTHRGMHWAEAPIKIARMTLTIKLDRNWSSFQLANNTPPLSVTGSVIAPSARMDILFKRNHSHFNDCLSFDFMAAFSLGFENCTTHERNKSPKQLHV